MTAKESRGRSRIKRIAQPKFINNDKVWPATAKTSNETKGPLAERIFNGGKDVPGKLGNEISAYSYSR